MGEKSATIVKTGFGNVGILQNGAKISRLWLPGLSRNELVRQIRKYSPTVSFTKSSPLMEKLTRYFSGRKVSFNCPIDYENFPDFSITVLKELQKIGWGKTATYKGLAERIGNPRAARAVGMVMAKNPVPLIIPCHRVIRSDGGLGGFTTTLGIELKRRMLALESKP